MANIELDGVNKKIKVDSGDLTLDVPGDIVLDADGGDVVFADGGTNLLKVTNSSSDVVLQPQVDTKDIVFKQYDGTVVATVEDNATFNIPASKLAIGGTAVTSTAAELNILDGVTSTTAELNIMDGVTATAAEINLIDGGTARGTTAIADGDGVLINDAGTMRQTTVETLKTYIGGGENTPSFQAQNSSRTSVSNSTYTKIAYTTENWDLGGDYDASNSRFTPQTAGKYYVYHSGGFNTGDDFEPLRVAIYKNGSLLIENQYRQAYYDIHYVGGAVDMNGSTDYLEAYASQNSGSTKDFDNNNNVRVKFGAFRIIT